MTPSPHAGAQTPLDEAALFARNHALARRAAASSAVLLRNERQVLPLTVGPASSLAVIGLMATKAAVRYQGAGSAAVNAHTLDEPLAALMAALGQKAPGATLTYAPGYSTMCEDDPAMLKKAVDVATMADAAIVFVGLPPTYEVEGSDRQHMGIPTQMRALMAAVAEVNTRTIVVLLGGAPMELPACADTDVAALLWMGLGGQALGGAVTDLLLGNASPGGRLAETWPRQLSDCPCQPHFGRAASIRQVVYREGLHVGYRHFCTAGVPVRYPFGHGLSYTTFHLSGLSLSKTMIAPGEGVRVQCKVTNTGRVAAAEVVQLYVRDVVCSVARPDRELKAFAKVQLAPGKSENVTLELTSRAFAFYDLAAKVCPDRRPSHPCCPPRARRLTDPGRLAWPA